MKYSCVDTSFEVLKSSVETLMSSYLKVYWAMSSYLMVYWTMSSYLMVYWTTPSNMTVYCFISWYVKMLLTIPWSRIAKRRDSPNVCNTHFNIFFNLPLTRTAFLQSITSKIVYAFLSDLTCALYTVQIIHFSPIILQWKVKITKYVSTRFLWTLGYSLCLYVFPLSSCL